MSCHSWGSLAKGGLDWWFGGLDLWVSTQLTKKRSGLVDWWFGGLMVWWFGGQGVAFPFSYRSIGGLDW